MIGDQSHHIRVILIGKAGIRTTPVTIGLVIKAIVDMTIMTIASAIEGAEIKS
jgi:hypothetical protein